MGVPQGIFGSLLFIAYINDFRTLRRNVEEYIAFTRHFSNTLNIASREKMSYHYVSNRI